MVTRKEIRISIGKDGQVHLQPVGAEGGKCLEWTREIESALGTVVAREMKPEFFEQNTDEIHAQNDD